MLYKIELAEFNYLHRIQLFTLENGIVWDNEVTLVSTICTQWANS